MTLLVTGELLISPLGLSLLLRWPHRASSVSFSVSGTWPERSAAGWRGELGNCGPPRCSAQTMIQFRHPAPTSEHTHCRRTPRPPFLWLIPFHRGRTPISFSVIPSSRVARALPDRASRLCHDEQSRLGLRHLRRKPLPSALRGLRLRQTPPNLREAGPFISELLRQRSR